MSDNGHPVSVEVTRPDGSVEQVRVGTAFREGEGFKLVLGELSIGGAPVAAASRRSAPSQASFQGSGGGGGEVTNFPNYGRSKGAPIQGASQQDLEYYANGARRSLGDPSKARWHDRERALIAAIDAELARQGLGSGGGTRREQGGQAGAPGGWSGGGEPPPPGDEDAPF